MKPIPALALAISALLSAAGCDLDALPDFDRDTQIESDQTHHDDPRAPPAVMLLHVAVDMGELHEDAAMTEAQASVRATHDDVRAAHDALRLALASAVGRGSISPDGFTAERAAIEVAVRPRPKP